MRRSSRRWRGSDWSQGRTSTRASSVSSTGKWSGPSRNWRFWMGVRLKREPTTNGWLYFTKGVGNWGTDYLLRAMANALGPGWNRPQDAVYPLSQRDGNSDDYDGAAHRYVIHFDKGQLPPAQAFWSL